jgi:hypothetical protein
VRAAVLGGFVREARVRRGRGTRQAGDKHAAVESSSSCGRWFGCGRRCRSVSVCLVASCGQWWMVIQATGVRGRRAMLDLTRASQELKSAESETR